MPHPPPATASPEADVDPRPPWASTEEMREVFAESMSWLRSLSISDLGAETLEALDGVADVVSEIETLQDIDADPEAIDFLMYTLAIQLVCAQDTHERETGQRPEPENPMPYDEFHRRHIAPFEAAARGVAKRVRRRSHHSTTRIVRPRRRGAGRPRAAATRSSARSGDSGDDDASGEPAPARSLRLAPPPKTIYTFACLPADDRGQVVA